MAKWTKSGAADMTASYPHLFRERTRKWYVWMYRANTTAALEVRLYASAADAAGGNANYAASGSIAYATLQAGLSNRCNLTNNAPVPPTFTNSWVQTAIGALTETGTVIWECDLGTRIARAAHRLVRAFSSISQTNGYFTNLNVSEIGLRMWEGTDQMRPYVGIAVNTIRATPLAIGGSLQTEVSFVCVAFLDVTSLSDVTDANTLLLYHDLRRALRAVDAESDVAVGFDDPVWHEAMLTMAETDKGLEWARERGALIFTVSVTVNELATEVTGG